jgi:putative ABC transport system ATP-binding protein
MAEPVIDLQGICKDYHIGKETLRVLHEVNLQVMPGAYVAIMGHSGSGKSTLLNIMGCLDRATCGRYLFHGRDVSSYSGDELADIRNHQIGFVFQSFNLLPKLTVEANVELPLIYANVPAAERRQRVTEILERFGLANRRRHKPNEISGGQKQRVAMARALVKKPAIILADEPTGNLDSHTSHDIMGLLDTLNADGNTILLITHESDIAEHARTVRRLTDGRFVS